MSCNLMIFPLSQLRNLCLWAPGQCRALLASTYDKQQIKGWNFFKPFAQPEEKEDYYFDQQPPQPTKVKRALLIHFQKLFLK